MVVADYNDGDEGIGFGTERGRGIVTCRHTQLKLVRCARVCEGLGQVDEARTVVNGKVGIYTWERGGVTGKGR